MRFKGLFAMILSMVLSGVAAGWQQVQPDAKLLVGKRQFSATVRRVLPDRLELSVSATETLTLNLNPVMVAKLRLAPRRTYRMLANQRSTPGGVNAAVRLMDSRGLYAIAEEIQDVPLLQPDEREGIKVEQLPRESRTLVYEDECKTVYNVPTAFTVNDQRLILQAHEDRAVRIRGSSYTLSLTNSQFIVNKECRIVYEGGRTQIGYTLVRN
jgi:hypothetical protein